MGLLFLDIDHFKRVNDERGHWIGDALLQAFAMRLSPGVRSTDTVALLGGDDFTVIMESLPRSEVAATVAEKIVASMGGPFALGAEAVDPSVAPSVGTSLGLAFYRGGAASATELLQQADEMLYESKAAGRDCSRVVWPQPAAEQGGPAREASSTPASDISAAPHRPAR